MRPKTGAARVEPAIGLDQRVTSTPPGGTSRPAADPPNGASAPSSGRNRPSAGGRGFLFPGGLRDGYVPVMEERRPRAGTREAAR